VLTTQFVTVDPSFNEQLNLIKDLFESDTNTSTHCSGYTSLPTKLETFKLSMLASIDRYQTASVILDIFNIAVG